jgi:REP element-mobilizing transposase RayT
MPHSFVKIWVHAIWATKERYPLIQRNIETLLYNHMTDQFKSTGCPVKIINGMPDHVHCLFLLNPQKSIAEVIKQIKGSTSHWVNEKDLADEKFSWQTGYAAYAVSESQLEKVYQYIKNQKAHHAKTTFSKEYDEFVKLHGFENNLNQQ